ncbi:YuzF family protein [Paenibacillus chibensis]|uniref:YuzF family protein n=1 Tax=Paenibacillus chibensis TaxID=59846 RepID=A0ABU6PPH6_9BACL|nr:YuzF family protein [Paenibacillus chibensis]
MLLNNYPMHHQMSQMPQSVVVHPVDPYVVETLRSVIGRHVLLETTRGGLSGCVADVKPDHVVLEARSRKFFVRICEIVWIMPE